MGVCVFCSFIGLPRLYLHSSTPPYRTTIPVFLTSCPFSSLVIKYNCVAEKNQKAVRKIWSCMQSWCHASKTERLWCGRQEPSMFLVIKRGRFRLNVLILWLSKQKQPVLWGSGYPWAFADSAWCSGLCGSYVSSHVSTLQTLRSPVDLCSCPSLPITPCFQDLFKICPCFSLKCVLL